MAWYRCSCGALKEATPRFGDAVVSIYHLHRSARLDGASDAVEMEEVPAPPAEPRVRVSGGVVGGGGED